MNAVTEEPVVSIKVDLNKNMSSTLEQIRDQIMPSEERVVSRNMSNTPQQTPDNGIESDNGKESSVVYMEGNLAKNIYAEAHSQSPSRIYYRRRTWQR